MALPYTLPSISPEEYLASERNFGERREYLDGLVYAMAGESLAHSRICINLAAEFRTRLRGTPCEALSPNMKVRTTPAGLFAYPDLTIVCGEPQFHDDRQDVITNPVVIFEVLPKSTATYDRGEKALRYRTQTESLRDLIFISQNEPRAERHTRQPDGTWTQEEVTGLDAVLDLASINCRVPLAEIYDRVTFEAK